MSDEALWPFDVLGLSASESTKRDIRKAYAKKLKKIDQEADRDGFDALRTAYQLALSSADSPKDLSDAPISDAADELSPNERLLTDVSIQNVPEGPPPIQFTADEQALIDRVTDRQVNEPDTIRLTSVISDPHLSDPVVAQTVEEEIYYYLLDKIDFETSNYPRFDFSEAQNGVRGETDELQVRHLMDALDDRFGWLSDQIGMQRRFAAYDTFLDAALNLGTTAQVMQETTSEKGIWGHVTWLVIIGIWFSFRMFAAYDPSSSDPINTIREAEILRDAAFLYVSGPSGKPSPQMTNFLRNLADEQGFQEKTTSDVNLLVARNWAVWAVSRSVAQRTNAEYDNLEELKYITGVLLAARYQLIQNLGYRETKEFRLSWEPERKTGAWRITKAGAESDSLWQPGGGFVVAEDQDNDPNVFRAIYPAKFLNAMRKATGDDLRALEGALGLKAYTLEKNPYLRFFYYPEIDIPGDLTGTVDLDRHYLSRTGLGSNRWPIRAAPILNESCEVLTISPGSVSTAYRC